MVVLQDDNVSTSADFFVAMMTVLNFRGAIRNLNTAQPPEPIKFAEPSQLSR